MGHYVFEHLAYFFDKYGYWTVFFGLLLENAGVPVPGETILLFASFLASTKHQLNIFVVAAVAVVAATTGDNIGFAIGHFGGRPLLERYKGFFHISDESIHHGEELLNRHGGLAIFFARFITGVRVVAGPLAGVLRMHWVTFLKFNAAGACAWVAAITTVAFVFGSKFQRLLYLMSRLNLVLLALIFAAVVLWIWKRRSGSAGQQTQTSKKPGAAQL